MARSTRSWVRFTKTPPFCITESARAKSLAGAPQLRAVCIAAPRAHAPFGRHMQRAAAIFENKFGGDHPKTLESRQLVRAAARAHFVGAKPCFAHLSRRPSNFRNWPRKPPLLATRPRKMLMSNNRDLVHSAYAHERSFASLSPRPICSASKAFSAAIESIPRSNFFIRIFFANLILTSSFI